VTAQIVPVAIMAGESLSAPLDCSVGEVAYVLMPGQWDGANLTFQVSSDGVTYWDLYDASGDEVMVGCKPGVAVRVRAGLGGLGYLKIRSGRSADPVPQSESRNFKIVF